MNRIRSDHELDALLAEGRLSAPTADRILESVLADEGVGADRSARPRWKRRAALAAGLFAAVGAMALLVPRGDAPADGFATKGSAQPAGGALLDVFCQEGTLDECPLGATLLFALNGGGREGFLAAYAEPASGGDRVWYFSSDTDTPAFPSGPGTRFASKGIRLGPEHRPGEYRLRLFLTRVPLAKTALLTGQEHQDVHHDVIATRDVKLQVIGPRVPPGETR